MNTWVMVWLQSPAAFELEAGGLPKAKPAEPAGPV